MLQAQQERDKFQALEQSKGGFSCYLVRNCKYSCGFTPAESDLSLDEISKNTVKQVFLSRLHIFQAVVFPSPMTVLATAGPFCKTFNVQNELL